METNKRKLEQLSPELFQQQKANEEEAEKISRPTLNFWQIGRAHV